MMVDVGYCTCGAYDDLAPPWWQLDCAEGCGLVDDGTDDNDDDDDEQ